MTTGVVTVASDTPVAEIAKLLLQRHISAVPVVGSDGDLVGIVSEGDLIRRVAGDDEGVHSWWLALLLDPEALAERYVKSHGSQAADVMTREVVAVDEDTPASEIARLLEERRIKRVPVMREGRLVGLVSRADLLRAVAVGAMKPAAPATADDRAIRDAVLRALRRHEWFHGSYMNAVVIDGVAHLWGMVGSETERKAARIAAEEVPGVRAVEDHMLPLPPGAWIEEA